MCTVFCLIVKVKIILKALTWKDRFWYVTHYVAVNITAVFLIFSVSAGLSKGVVKPRFLGVFKTKNLKT